MSVIRAMLLAAVCAGLAASGAEAAGVTVTMDEVTLVSFKRPVAAVYLGNPDIADVMMIDSQHYFVLGKSFGSTNLIALGADKSVVVNEPVMVSSARVSVITLNRGISTYHFSCTTYHCEARPAQGDPKPSFSDVEDEIAQHQEAAQKAAAPGAGSSGGQSVH